MYFYLYEIRNNLNGKIYVGVHKTKDLDDGYMGSGKVIRAAIAKHGAENFTKTILEHFESKEEMYAREKEVITEEFLAREDAYNLRRGGEGGWGFVSTEFRRQNINKLNNGSIDHIKRCRLGGTNAAKLKPWLKVSSDSQKGNKNSQFGMKWITNEYFNSKLKEHETLPFGWRYGRKMKVPFIKFFDRC